MDWDCKISNKDYGTVADLPDAQEQTEYIDAVPAEYFSSTDQHGQVVQVNYESKDFM